MIYLFRLAHLLHRLKVPLLPYLIYVINRIVFSVVLPPSVRVGRDVTFGYHGLATVVHARAIIGNRVTIAHGVTVGGRSGLAEVPIIEDDVQVGAGACILGPVRIGAGARIGANAIVVKDVPPGGVCVAAPGQVRAGKSDSENAGTSD
ncbi:MAG: serine O-acetyltransferase [Aquabacterium sp.]